MKNKLYQEADDLATELIMEVQQLICNRIKEVHTTNTLYIQGVVSEQVGSYLSSIAMYAHSLFCKNHNHESFIDTMNALVRTNFEILRSADIKDIVRDIDDEFQKKMMTKQ